jgi:hypothetical protein
VCRGQRPHLPSRCASAAALQPPPTDIPPAAALEQATVSDLVELDINDQSLAATYFGHIDMQV